LKCFEKGSFCVGPFAASRVGESATIGVHEMAGCEQGTCALFLITVFIFPSLLIFLFA
jgi:hypothetical protein